MGAGRARFPVWMEPQNRYRKQRQQMIDLTMVKTRQSSGGKPLYPLDSSHKGKRQRVLSEHAIGIQRLGRGSSECFDILKLLLAQATKGVWFRILPVDDGKDDISHWLGVEWKYLLPILMKCGLLKSRVTSVVKVIHVNHSQWDELARACEVWGRICFTACRTANCRRTYFVSIGDRPLFSSPLLQYKSSQQGCFVPPSRGPPARQLALSAHQTAQAILNERVAQRVQPNNHFNDAEIEHVATAIDAAIDFALALDLERRPRLSKCKFFCSLRLSFEVVLTSFFYR